jgi:hypothetical protein
MLILIAPNVIVNETLNLLGWLIESLELAEASLLGVGPFPKDAACFMH